MPSDPHILYFDTDPARREKFGALLCKHWSCEVIDDIAKARDTNANVAIVGISDHAGYSIEYFHKIARYIAPDHVAVLSDSPFDAQLESLFEAGVRQFIGGAGTRLERDLLWQVRALASKQPALSLENIFGRTAESRFFAVRDRWERQEALDQIVEFFSDAEFPAAVVDIRLALDELLNNAIYHAFKEEDGQEKYTPDSFDTLHDGETVTIEVARDADYNLVLVSDSAGSLMPDMVMRSIGRHLTMQGLMDEHGRGFFLMRSLCDGIIICNQPRVRTDVTLVFGRHHSALVKTLMIKCL